MVIKYPIVFIRVKDVKWKKSYVPKERVNQKSTQTEIRTLSKQGKKKKKSPSTLPSSQLEYFMKV